jgi:hypothetical protein
MVGAWAAKFVFPESFTLYFKPAFLISVQSYGQNCVDLLSSKITASRLQHLLLCLQLFNATLYFRILCSKALDHKNIPIHLLLFGILNRLIGCKYKPRFCILLPILYTDIAMLFG